MKKELNNILAEIAKKIDASTNQEEAIKKGHNHYLNLEYNSVYGGYRLININVRTGSHAGAFGYNGCENRLKAKEMVIKLRGILSGLNYE